VTSLLVTEVEDVPEGWQDPDFPHNEESLGPKVSQYTYVAEQSSS